MVAVHLFNLLLLAVVALVAWWRAGHCRGLRGHRGMSGRGLRSGERFVGQVGRGRVVLDVAADGACVRPAVDAADEPEGHVDPGGDTLAGDEVAVDDVAG